MGSPNVIDVLNEAIELLSHNEKASERYSSEIEWLKRRIRIAETNSYRIGVIGVTSSGKSTLINSFLGESLLPSRPSPSSCQLVRCHHSDKKRAIVFFEDNTVMEYQGDDVTQELISSFADENINSKNIKGVREIEICTPDFPFADDVLLIDSPGLDAFGYEGHEKLTMASLLPTVDMCMLISTCKPNSDLKLLEVLNAISETDHSGMPVILVQNMMDSIQPSPDGRKSRDDVAKDHMRRLERIVKQSSIRDESAVYIVQYSAINAIQGIRDKNPVLLGASNYQRLVDTLHKVVFSIQPIINSSRLVNVREELTRIAEDAKKDAGLDGALVETGPFQFATVKDEMNDYLASREEENDLSIALMDVIITDISNTSFFTQSIIDAYLERIREVESNIFNTISSTNTFLKGISEQLNIDYRDLSSPALVSQKSSPTLHRKYTYERIKKGGFWAKVQRVFGSSSGYETRKDLVTDHEATKEELIQYANANKGVYYNAIDAWWKNTIKIKGSILEEVSLRKKQFDNRVLHALEAQSYLEISRKLLELVDSISIEDIALDQYSSDKRVIKPKDELIQIEVDKSDYALYSLSLWVKQRIQKGILDSLVGQNKRVLIVGNDVVSELFFVSQMLMERIDPDAILDGRNDIAKGITLFHGNTVPEGLFHELFSSLFILINGTQIGTAEKQLYSLVSKARLGNGIKVFWVVQDLQEAINAHAVCELLQELQGFKGEYFPNEQIIILVSHPNPIYNLAVTALQEKGMLLQTDRVVISDELQKRFHYLYDDESRIIIHDIIKAFN